MKKVILVALFVLMLTPIAFAGEKIHNVVGGKLDMPNLVGLFNPDLHLGLEASKDIATNVFYDSFAGVEDDFGASAYLKVTFTGCIINCSK